MPGSTSSPPWRRADSSSAARWQRSSGPVSSPSASPGSCPLRPGRSTTPSSTATTLCSSTRMRSAQGSECWSWTTWSPPAGRPARWPSWSRCWAVRSSASASWWSWSTSKAGSCSPGTMSAVRSNSTVTSGDVKYLGLAKEGQALIDWAAGEMPVLLLIRDRFREEKPLAGMKVSACLHVTSETANLMLTLKAGGADVVLCASNPLSTNDAVAAALVSQHTISTYAIRGEDNDTYYSHIEAVLDHRPVMTMDDGADLVSVLHKSRQEQIAEIIGGTEETTTGVVRLRAMADRGVLRYPIVAVNEADTKHMFDNRYGTGQAPT